MADAIVNANFKLLDLLYHPELGLQAYFYCKSLDLGVWVEVSADEQRFVRVEPDDFVAVIPRLIARCGDCGHLVDERWN